MIIVQKEIVQKKMSYSKPGGKCPRGVSEVKVPGKVSEEETVRSPANQITYRRWLKEVVAKNEPVR